jgi:hypothetical protein
MREPGVATCMLSITVVYASTQESKVLPHLLGASHCSLLVQGSQVKLDVCLFGLTLLSKLGI